MPLMLEKSETHKASRAVIYARVSSTKQTTRGDGLNSQITRCREYAKYKGYEIVEVFQDDSSGSLTERPGMQALLKFLRSKRSDPHVVIIDDISRLARGIEAHLALRSAISGAGGLLESPSIEFGEDSDSQLVENLLAAVSQHQRQKNGEQTKNRMIARASNGYWVFHAPLGYKFEKVGGHSKLLVRHEPMASAIRQALEGFASGRFETQAEVLRFFESLPHFPRDSRGIIRHQRIRDILTNPIYAGMVEIPNWNIPRREGHHEALISYQDFLKIQERLTNKAKVPVRKNVAEDFPLRGFVTCGDCGTILTSCWAKGRTRKYPYYHCPTKGCESYGKSIRRDVLEGEFEALLGQLSPSRNLYEIAYSMFKDAWDQQLTFLKAQIQEMEKKRSELDAQITQLLDRIVQATSNAVISAYESRIQQLEADKLLLEEKIKSAGKPQKPFEESFRTAMQFLSNPAKLWHSGNLGHKKTVLKLTFADRLPYTRNKGFRTARPSLPFQVIQELKESLEGDFASKGNMARRGRFELPTPRFVVWCSIQLSYRRLVCRLGL